jgi:hypothetical protein
MAPSASEELTPPPVIPEVDPIEKLLEGSVAALEEKELGRKRLGWGSILDRKERKRAEMERNADRDAAREDRKLKQEENERGRYQMMTDAQGNIVRVDKQTNIAEPALGPQGKPLQGKVSDKVSTAAQALDETLIKANLLQQLVTAHKDTLALGPLQGGPSEFMQRYGFGATTAKADMYRIMKDLANRSGAQINNKEFERLRATLADPNATEVSIDADLKAFIASATRQKQRFQERGVWDDDWSPEQGNGKQVPDSITTPTTEVTGSQANRSELPPRRHRALRVE